MSRIGNVVFKHCDRSPFEFFLALLARTDGSCHQNGYLNLIISFATVGGRLRIYMESLVQVSASENRMSGNW
ncbi:hypothetical protein MKW98_006363 [Papaver atlanticum]|uniref:Uncharacterized protein n=1 Tax=Papaver atlanticum TaxID=357466 RepID=A0AAD4RUU3_9MAGN|nr:hypothetical protein MKW98_006363 [Papaver atlanticum]